MQIKIHCRDDKKNIASVLLSILFQRITLNTLQLALKQQSVIISDPIAFYDDLCHSHRIPFGFIIYATISPPLAYYSPFTAARVEQWLKDCNSIPVAVLQHKEREEYQAICHCSSDNLQCINELQGNLAAAHKDRMGIVWVSVDLHYFRPTQPFVHPPRTLCTAIMHCLPSWSPSTATGKLCCYTVLVINSALCVI